MAIAGGAIGNHSFFTHFAPSRRSESFRLAISQGCSLGNLQITPDGNRKHSGLPVRHRVGTLKASRMLHGKGRGTVFLFDWRYQSWLGAAGFAVAIGVAYFMAAWLGLALRADTGTSVFWPAAGIAVGALIVWGPAARLPVAAGVLVATAVANLMIGRNGWLSVAFGIVNVGQALLTTTLIERWFGRSFKLGNVPQVLGFLAASALGSAVGAVGATIAVGLIQSTASPFIVWRFWFASCLLGMVTVAPLLVGIAEAVRQMPPRRELIEGAVGVLMLAALSAFVISLPQGPWSTALPVVVIFPVLLWIAVRCRPVFAAAAVVRCRFSRNLVDNLQRRTFRRRKHSSCGPHTCRANRRLGRRHC